MVADQTGRSAKDHQDRGDHLLSRDDIEFEYRLTRRWLELAALRGDGPPFLRISRRMVRYRRADFEQWLANCQRTNTAEQ
jgi:hypothetical protein